MTLENPSYIEDFDSTAPTYQDFKAEGDDHLRNIKKAIKQTFPGLNGQAWRKRSVSASGALSKTDNMSLVRAGSALTLTPAAAASLGNGWMTIVHAAGGAVTIDPTGGEKINSADTMVVPSGYMAFVFGDGTEFFSFLVYTDVVPVAKPFATGTKVVFQQTTAPVGWTKVTSGAYNDAALRFTTGTAATGGLDNFTSTFGTGKSTAGHTLTSSQMPYHEHYMDLGRGTLQSNANTNTNEGVWADRNTGGAGGGGSHSHSLNNMNLKYIDCIVATLD